jgi:RNA polymerase sigma factor FliA
MEQTLNNRWSAFIEQRTPELRRELATSYVNLVRYVVNRLGFVEQAGPVLREGDLVQYGVIGLMSAIDRFDPARGVRFETYAIPRIRGTILDELRKLDPRSRLERKRERATPAAAQMRPVLAARDTAGTLEDDDTLVCCDVENLAGEDEADPEQQLLEAEETRVLADALAALPERERLVITLHYYEGLSQRDIAAVLNLSESRISQVHTAVMQRLRLTLGQAGFTTRLPRR